MTNASRTKLAGAIARYWQAQNALTRLVQEMSSCSLEIAFVLDTDESITANQRSIIEIFDDKADEQIAALAKADSVIVMPSAALHMLSTAGEREPAMELEPATA